MRRSEGAIFVLEGENSSQILKSIIGAAVFYPSSVNGYNLIEQLHLVNQWLGFFVLPRKGWQIQK